MTETEKDRIREERIAILTGILTAIENRHAVLDIFSESATADEAQSRLMQEYSLSETAARPIRDIQIQHFTQAQVEKLNRELSEQVANRGDAGHDH